MITKMHENCKHHWKIESPNGTTSKGKCRKCGEIKEFYNSHSYSMWNMTTKAIKSSITDEMIENAIKRQANKGITWQIIADEYGITRNHLHKLVKAYKERPSNKEKS